MTKARRDQRFYWVYLTLCAVIFFSALGMLVALAFGYSGVVLWLLSGLIFVSTIVMVHYFDRWLDSDKERHD